MKMREVTDECATQSVLVLAGASFSPSFPHRAAWEKK
jgi:hypothetical protein